MWRNQNGRHEFAKGATYAGRSERPNASVMRGQFYINELGSFFWREKDKIFEIDQLKWCLQVAPLGRVETSLIIPLFIAERSHPRE